MKEVAFLEAKQVLLRCSTEHGFHAAFPGYMGVWARDSAITGAGASLYGKDFKNTFRESLITLGKNQSPKGQIPNAVLFDRTPRQVDFQSIDSSLWYIISHYVYKKMYRDSSIIEKHKHSISKALTWLSYQDMGEDGLLEQNPTTDWQDAFPHRYGHTINTQALYYYVLNLVGDKKQAKKLKHKVNEDKGLGLWNGHFYLPWRWKNHNKYHEKGEWFDSLGNLLAIVFGLANDVRANKILDYIKENKIDKPYPVKAIYPPIYKGSTDWHDYFEDCEARTPYHYLNGGIWTYIGGFYVLALLRMKRYSEAENIIERLAEANLRKPIFSEWLDGKTGKPGFSHSGSQEGNQAWNAGAYVLAYKAVKEKKFVF